MTQRVVIASHNQGKIRELQTLLSPLGMNLKSLSSWTDRVVEETGDTFVENALVKARHAAQLTGIAAIADDSGLVVDLLDGEPGVRSSRYAGEKATDQQNLERLLDRISKKASKEQPVTAHFHATLVFLRSATDPTPIIASGNWYGTIVGEPQGTNGFGYDPIFQPDGHSVTSSQLSPDVKNRLSHRGQAVKKLAKLLSESLRKP